jgi:hypothetical protein
VEVGRERILSGMIGVITAAPAGSAAGLLAAVASDHSLAAALASGVAVFVGVLWALMRYQSAAWAQAGAVPSASTTSDQRHRR